MLSGDGRLDLHVHRAVLVLQDTCNLTDRLQMVLSINHCICFGLVIKTFLKLLLFGP